MGIAWFEINFKIGEGDVRGCHTSDISYQIQHSFGVRVVKMLRVFAKLVAVHVAIDQKIIENRTRRYEGETI